MKIECVDILAKVLIQLALAKEIVEPKEEPKKPEEPKKEEPPKPQPKPEPKEEPKKPEEPKEYYLRAVAKGRKDEFGNELIGLSVCEIGSTEPISTLHVVSGQAYAQRFKKGGTGEQPGSMEPLPEGLYELGPVEWAGSKGDYETYWNAGLGPVWVAIEPKFSTARGGFGGHLDANRSTAPGTAGCLGILTIDDLKVFVSWFDKYKLAGQTLVADWPDFGSPDGIGEKPTPKPVPKSNLSPSKACEDLIKKWEGLDLNAYVCPAGVITIGRGSIYNYDQKRPVKMSDRIDEATADRWFRIELEEKAKGVAELVPNATQGQFDALVSFSYNVGLQAFATSTLLKKFKAGDTTGAANEFDRWVHGDNREVLPGLVSRRKDEKALFVS